MQTRHKVGALVIRRPPSPVGASGRAQLLLFTQLDAPEAPIQFPGGGLEPGENPLEGARRELREEAGLDGLPLIRALGVSEWPAPSLPGLLDLTLRRHCFLFDGDGLPDAWEHVVTGEGEDRAMRFAYRWHDIAPGFTLAGDLGHFVTPEHLPELFAAPYRIRQATPADASAIARIHVETWRHAYRGLVPDAHLDGLSIERRSAGWEQNLRSNPDATLVAEREGKIAGWINFGACRDEGESASATEIFALYIDPLHQRAGLGRALTLAAERRMAECFPAAIRVTLWVLERNHTARCFYESLGYAPDGISKTELIGGTPLVELRYAKSLAP